MQLVPVSGLKQNSEISKVSIYIHTGNNQAINKINNNDVHDIVLDLWFADVAAVSDDVMHKLLISSRYLSLGLLTSS